MITCKSIEPLLYLYRDDELSADERKRVLEHCEACPQCQAVLDDLMAADDSLAGIRNEYPFSSGSEDIVAETMQHINRSDSGRGEVGAPGIIDAIFGWLRPSFATLLIFAAMVLGTQISRDLVRSWRLERQLEARGNSVTASELSGRTADDVLALADQFAAFRDNSPLFSDLARQFPELARINPHDGLSDRERNILRTQGRELMREVETLIRRGDHRL